MLHSRNALLSFSSFLPSIASFGRSASRGQVEVKRQQIVFEMIRPIHILDDLVYILEGRLHLFLDGEV
jgi:ethanolamine utilization protein EutQ (cupin superfamily)